VPVEITCFTNRRHNRSRVRKSPWGKFVFVCVNQRIYSPPEQGIVASREQAFCDFLFIACHRGVAPESQVTFRGLETLDASLLKDLVKSYPRSVAKKALQIAGI
jgi:hypothetical protein